MTKISTWNQLIMSDLPLSGEDVTTDVIGHYYATIVRHDDGALRLNYGLLIHSDIYEFNGVKVLDVQEGPITHGDPIFLGRFAPVPDVSKSIPRYRIAGPLGLDGNHRDPGVHSVLVAVAQLEQLEFTDDPAPLQQWEIDLLTGP